MRVGWNNQINARKTGPAPRYAYTGIPYGVVRSACDLWLLLNGHKVDHYRAELTDSDKERYTASFLALVDKSKVQK